MVMPETKKPYLGGFDNIDEIVKAARKFREHAEETTLRGILSKHFEAKPEEPYFISGKQAQAFGFDIPEEWQLKAFKETTDEGDIIQFSEVTPSGWEVAGEDLIISPQGQKMTIEETRELKDTFPEWSTFWQAPEQVTPEAPVEAVIAPQGFIWDFERAQYVPATFDLEVTKKFYKEHPELLPEGISPALTPAEVEELIAEQEIKQEQTTRAFVNIFPELEPEEGQTYEQLVAETLTQVSVNEEVQDWFTSGILEKGRTPETEAILRQFGFTDKGITDFFGVPSERERAQATLGISWEEATTGKFEWKELGNLALASIGVVFGPVEKYVVRPWETAILEARSRLEVTRGTDREIDRVTLQRLDELRDKYGWASALVDEDVSDIWRNYLEETQGGTKVLLTVLDFANPAFLIPIGGTFGLIARFTSKVPVIGKSLGYVAKGVNAVERGMAKPISKPLELGVKGLERVGMSLGEKASAQLLKRSQKLVMDIADSEAIINGVVVDNWLRRSIQFASKIPFVKAGIQRTLGTHILVDKTGKVVMDVVGRGAILNAQIRKMGVNLANIKKQELRAVLPNPIEGFGFNKQAFSSVMAKKLLPAYSEQKAVAGTLEHIFSHPEMYKLSERQLQYITRFNELQDSVLNLLVKEGIPPEHLIEDWVHRVIVDASPSPIKAKRPRAIGAIPSYERPRKFDTMAEGIEWFMKHPEYGKAYANNPELLIGRYVEEAFNKIAGERFVKYTGEFGITPAERVAQRFPELVERAQLTKTELADAAKFQSIILRASRGEKLPEQTLKAMESRFPEMGAKLRALVKEPARDIPHSTQAQGLLEKYKPLLREVESVDFLKNPKEYDLAVKKLEGFVETLSGSERSILDKALEVDALLKTAGKDLFGYPAPLNMSASITTKKVAFEALKKEAKALVETRKAPFWQARTAKAEKMEQLRRPELGEGYIQAPFASGKIYQQDFIDSFNKFFGYEPGSAILKPIADTAGVLRITKAALDFSAMAIQGLTSFGLAHAYMLVNPKKGAQLMGQWYKATAYSIRGFFDPQSIAKYIAKNTATATQRVSFGGSSRSIDYFAALEARHGIGGLGEAALRKLPLKPFQRAETSFFGFSEIVRDEFWRILSPKAIKQGKGFELARHLDLSTGITEAAFQGVPLTTRQLEQSFLWFAPNYTRASLTLVADIFRGGMSGEMARKSLGALLGAGVGYYSVTQYASAILAGKSEDEAMEAIMEGLGVETDPITGESEWKPTGRFMTLKVGNYNFGIGGFWYGLVRLSGNIMATINEVGERERIDLVRILKHGSLNKQDNPFISWWYSRSSPFTGTGFELATGRDYLGYPIETPEEYAKYIATRFEPIWMEQGLNWMIPGMARDNEIPEGDARLAIVPVEVFGLRTFPDSAWVDFYDKANEIIKQIPEDELDEKQIEAWKAGKLTWSGLTEIQKMDLLNRYPDLFEQYEEAQADSAIRATPQWKSYQSRIEEERDIYLDRLAQLTEQLQKGEIDTREYREKAGEAGQNFGAVMDGMSRDPHYAEIYEYFETKQSKGDEYGYHDSVALAEFQSTILYAEDLIDSKGDYDWDERDRLIDEFIGKYGEDIYQRIQIYLSQKKEQKGVPPIWIRKAEDTEKLGRSYWRLPYKPIYEMDTEDEADGNIPSEYKALWLGYQGATDKESFLEKHPELAKDWRAEYRLANPEDDARLALWGYGGKLQSMEAYNLVEKWGQELGIPLEQMGLGLPPRSLIGNYFELNEIVRNTSGGSREAKLYKLENPDYLAFGVENLDWSDLADESIDALRLQVKYKDLYSLYEAYGDRKSDQYIKDSKDRQATREKLLADNPEFRDDRRRVDAYQMNLPMELIENYVEFYSLPSSGFWRERYRLENSRFNESMIDLAGLVPFDPDYKVPDIRYDEIYENWKELFDAYDDVIGTETERKVARGKILADNPDFASDRRRREAYGKFVPEKHIETYVSYFEVPGKPDDYPKNVSYYEDDWFLMEHEDFYKIVYLGIMGNKERDFSEVPTRKILNKYLTYLDKNEGQ